MSNAAKLVLGKNTLRRDILKIKLSAALCEVNLTFIDPKPDAPEAAFPPPVLIHDGKYQVGPVAICKYMAKTFKQNLLPSSIESYMKVDEIIEQVGSTLQPLADSNSCKVADQLEALEKTLKTQQYLVGDSLTIADIIAYCAVKDESCKGWEAYQPIVDWTERIQKDESIAKTLKNVEKAEAKEAAKKKMIDLNPPSGTRDMFPEQMRFRSWLFGTWKNVAKKFGFQEYDAPVLENEDLYKRKAGEEITQQMYNFVDKEGHRVTLRPEMTPTLARMVLSLTRESTGDIAALMPLKWFSIPQCWRFETTQRGRKREHYQWNCDIVGIKGITAELEVLAAAVDFCKQVGFTSDDIGVKVNSRKVLQAVVETAGVSKDMFAPVCVVIDKLDKIGDDAVAEELRGLGLSEEVARTIIASLGAKSLDEFAEVSGTKDSEEVAELRQLFALAKDYGIADWLRFDASVVRGLAYYTGVVFEGFDKSGQMRAIFGGGRYDRLMTLYGAKREFPCVGFGFGDCVIEELLKVTNKMPEFPHEVDYVVAAYNQDMVGPSMQVADALRAAGYVTDLMQEVAKKVGKAFNYADRVGARRIIFVGPDEWNKQLVRVKDLREEDESQKEKDIPFGDLANIHTYYNEQPRPSTGVSTASSGNHPDRF